MKCVKWIGLGRKLKKGINAGQKLKVCLGTADKTGVMEQLMTVREVGALLRITPQTIYKMVEERSLPGVRVGKQWRFEREKIRVWISDQTDKLPQELSQ